MATISNSLAGLRTAALRASVAATNIANANVEKFKALDFKQTVDTNGGPQGNVSYRTPPSVKTIDSEGNLVEVPNVSFDEEVLQTQLAVNDFKANATVLKVNKQLQGSLLDILA